ncbi:MAG: BACON domain-containing protein [Alistipes sp.]|nr:BACON domain-containing protein [Alistipes sp.]
MRKLFYLLLALPLVFAACENPEEPKPEVEKEAVLTLTSDAEMNFEAEGGEGVITFTAEWKDVTRNSPVPAPEVEATCEAQWVENLTVAENITFTVVANEADARETKVVVTYGDKSFEVAVKQAAKQNEQPEPPTGVNLEAKHFYGDYYGDEYSPGVGNYYMALSDLGISEDGYAYAGGSYYYVDLYGPLFDGEGDITLPVGTYTFDANDSCAEWTIGASYSAYMAWDENANSLTGEYGLPYTDATLVVTESGATLTATIDGVEHTVTFEGVADITDYRTNTGEVVEFTANHAYANYYGDQYTPGTANNFYFFLSDLGVDENGWELPNATYYRFDLYTEIIDTTNGIYIPEGTYTYDWFDSMQVGTFSDINSAYYVMDSTGWEYVVDSSLGDGSITFTESGVTAEVLVNGATHIITYEGDITFTDVSSSGGGGGGEEGGTLSTLTEDKVFDIEGATVEMEYYGDYYETGTENWVVYLYEDIENFNGAYLMLDLFCDPAADNIAGTYAADSWGNCDTAYTYIPGYVDGVDMWGSWYVDMLGGDINEDLAPIFDGEFTIDIDANGIYTFTFDCLDDVGYAITGSIKAERPSDAAALSAKPAKRAKANNFAKRVNSEKKSSKAVKDMTLAVR